MEDKKSNPAMWRLERELKSAVLAKEKLEMIFEKDKQRYDEKILKAESTAQDYLKQRNVLQTKLVLIEKELAELKGSKEMLVANLEKSDRLVSTIKNTYQSHSFYHKKLEQLEKDSSRSRLLAQAASQTQAQLVEQVKSLYDQNAHLEAAHHDLQENSALETQTLRGELAASQSQCETLAGSLVAKEQREQQLQGELMAAYGEREGIQQALMNAEEKIRQLTSEIQTLGQLITDSEVHMAHLKAEADGLRAMFSQKMEEGSSEYQGMKKKLEGDLQQLQSKMHEVLAEKFMFEQKTAASLAGLQSDLEEERKKRGLSEEIAHHVGQKNRELGQRVFDLEAKLTEEKNAKAEVLRQFEVEVENLTGELEAVTETQRQLELQVGETEEKKKVLTEERKRERDAMNSVLSDVKKRLQETQEAKSSLEALRLQDEQVMSSMKRHNEALDTEIQSLRATIEHAHQEAHRLSEQISQSQQQAHVLQDRTGQLQQRIQTLELQLSEAHALNEKLQATIATLQESLNTTTESLEQVKKTMMTQGKVLAERETIIADLGARLNQADGVIRGANEEIQRRDLQITAMKGGFEEHARGVEQEKAQTLLQLQREAAVSQGAREEARKAEEARGKLEEQLQKTSQELLRALREKGEMDNEYGRVAEQARREKLSYDHLSGKFRKDLEEKTQQVEQLKRELQQGAVFGKRIAELEEKLAQEGAQKARLIHECKQQSESLSNITAKWQIASQDIIVEKTRHEEEIKAMDAKNIELIAELEDLSEKYDACESLQTQLSESSHYKKALEELEAKNAMLAKNTSISEAELKKMYQMKLGHQNSKQKIQYVAKIKEENLRLQKENATLQEQFKRMAAKLAELEKEREKENKELRQESKTRVVASVRHSELFAPPGRPLLEKK